MLTKLLFESHLTILIILGSQRKQFFGLWAPPGPRGGPRGRQLPLGALGLNNDQRRSKYFKNNLF